MSFQTQLLILVAFVLSSFAGGWQVATWHMKSKELTEIKQAVEEHNKKEAEIVKNITDPLEKQLTELRKLQRNHKHATTTDCKLSPADVLLLKEQLPTTDRSE